MKIAEIRKMNTTDLTKKSTELREQIAEMRRRVHMGETTNVRILRNNRKDLARILTVLSEELQKETN